MEEMMKKLGADLIGAFTEALMKSGGIEEICRELVARRDRNVETSGEQSAQLTFTFRPRIEVSNFDFAIIGEVKVDEQKKSHVFRVERNFSLDGQEELPMNGGSNNPPETEEGDEE